MDDPAEEADHIEINGAASMCSTAIFSPHVFVENGQLVHVRSQWRASEKNTDYIKKYFKQKFWRIKFPTKNYLDAHLYVPQEWS